MYHALRITGATFFEIAVYAYNPIRVICKKKKKKKKLKINTRKLKANTKFSLREDSRLLSAPLPIVTLGSPLYILVLSLNFYFITDSKCESPPG